MELDTHHAQIVTNIQQRYIRAHRHRALVYFNFMLFTLQSRVPDVGTSLSPSRNVNIGEMLTISLKYMGLQYYFDAIEL